MEDLLFVAGDGGVLRPRRRLRPVLRPASSGPTRSTRPPSPRPERSRSRVDDPRCRRRQRRRPRPGGPAPRVPRPRPRLPREVLMSAPALFQLGALVLAARRSRRRSSVATSPPSTATPTTRARRAAPRATGSSARSSGSSTALFGVDDDAGAALERLRHLAARLQPRLGARCSTGCSGSRTCSRSTRTTSSASSRRSRGTPRSASPPTPTGRATAASTPTASATSSRWLGLTVQNFVSAAVGAAVVVALIRGIARRRKRTLGNFWVDLTRTTVRVLLPLVARAGRDLRRPRPDPEPRRLPRGHHRRGRHPADPRRAGGEPDRHQAARHERRRLLQRQRRPPVREPRRGHQLPVDVGDAGHPLRLPVRLRADGEGPQAGPRAPGRDGRRCGW